MTNLALSYKLDTIIDCEFKQALGTGKPFFARCIAEFKRKHTPEVFKNVINQKNYNWYFGNLAVKAMSIVFLPSLVLLKEPEDYSTCLNKEQVADVLNTCFHLIVEEGLDIYKKDYYKDTPYESLRQTTTHLYDIMPVHLRSAAGAFLCLYKRGPYILRVQKRAVRTWAEKRRSAVRKIEDWWFEVVNSPYSSPGKRLLEKRAVRWNNYH